MHELVNAKDVYGHVVDLHCARAIHNGSCNSILCLTKNETRKRYRISGRYRPHMIPTVQLCHVSLVLESNGHTHNGLISFKLRCIPLSETRPYCRYQSSASNLLHSPHGYYRPSSVSICNRYSINSLPMLHTLNQIERMN